MRVLVVSPHPDDESIGCGGTLRKHSVEGDEVRVLFLTSGEQGGHGIEPEETARLREAEALEATQILGIEDVEFWRQRDGGLRASKSLIERLSGSIQRYAPDVIYVPNELEAHSDHRAAARLVKAARREMSVNPKVFAFEVWTPLTSMDEIVDITPYIDSKIAAVRAYRSQCSILRFDEALLGLARYRGELFCWPKGTDNLSGKYAEVFQLLQT